MIYSNYHTHTTFCDGKDTPEQLIERALELGCPEIGFSGHSYTPFDESWCMSHEETQAYRECITRLKEKYRGRIKILLGIEQDLWSEEPTDGYDYVIGGVHYVRHGEHFLPTDESAELTRRIVDEYYSGDALAFCEEYYENAALLYERTRCDIIAHLDIITKFNEQDRIIDTSHPRYVRAAEKALDILCRTPARFEINTGAISRGYRSTAYPSPELIDGIKARGGRLILSSDCHARENLLYLFDDYSKYL